MDIDGDGKVDINDFWLLVKQFAVIACVSALAFYLLVDDHQAELIDDVAGSWPPTRPSDGAWGPDASDPSHARTKDDSGILWVIAPLSGNSVCVSQLLGSPCRHWAVPQLLACFFGAYMLVHGLAAVHAKEVRTRRVPGILGLFGYREKFLVDARHDHL